MSDFKKNTNSYKHLKKIIRLSPENAKIKKQLLIYEFKNELSYSIRELSANGDFIVNTFELTTSELIRMVNEIKLQNKVSKTSTHELLQEMDHRSLEETLER